MGGISSRTQDAACESADQPLRAATKTLPPSRSGSDPPGHQPAMLAVQSRTGVTHSAGTGLPFLRVR